MAAIKLYFDKVSHGGLHGQTENGEHILYNLKLIGEDWFNAYTDILLEHNKATIFVPTGRFLSAITASLNENKKSMNTFDLKNDMRIVKHFAAQSMGNDDIFMAAWRLIKYQKDFDKFKLIEGTPPIA